MLIKQSNLHFAFSPVPTITWRRPDGVPFPRKVDVGKSSVVLEIPYFQQEDAGPYECTAENSRGKNTVKGRLSFYGRAEIFQRLNKCTFLLKEKFSQIKKNCMNCMNAVCVDKIIDLLWQNVQASVILFRY